MATQISQRAPQTCKFHLQIKLSNSQHILPLSPISVSPPCGHVSEIANQLCRENGREKRWMGEAVQGHSWSLKCRCEDSLRQLIIRLVVLVALVVPPIRTKTLKSQGNRGGERRSRCATKAKDYRDCSEFPFPINSGFNSANTCEIH